MARDPTTFAEVFKNDVNIEWPTLPPRPTVSVTPEFIISDEEVISGQMKIIEFCKGHNLQDVRSITLLRQISGPRYINEKGLKSSTDWTNMFIQDVRNLKKYKVENSEMYMKNLKIIIKFIFYYRYEDEKEIMPKNTFNQYIKFISNMLD